MSFSYSSDLPTNRDKVRFLVQDTDSASFDVHDGEIDGTLGVEPNIFLAAAIVLRNLAVKAAKNAIRYSVGGEGRAGAVSVDRTKRPDYYIALAKAYEEKAYASPEEAWDSFDFVVDSLGVDRSEYVGDDTAPYRGGLDY